MNYNARAEPLFFSLDLLFSDAPVAVAVVVILNSLVTLRWTHHKKRFLILHGWQSTEHKNRGM